MFYLWNLAQQLILIESYAKQTYSKSFFFQSFFGHTGSGRKLERFLRGR